MGTFQMFNAREVASDVADNFLKGNSDKVEVIYGEFKSVAVQAPTFTHFLPVQPVQVVGTEKAKKFRRLYIRTFDRRDHGRSSASLSERLDLSSDA